LQKKRSYSSLYKIYRRIRFIRYRKRFLQERQAETRKKEIEEIKDTRARQKEFQVSQRQQYRVKSRVERQQDRELRKVLKEEIRQMELQGRQEWKLLSIEDKKKADKSRNREKIARRRKFRIFVRYQVRNFFLSFRSVNFATIRKRFRELKENAPQRKLFLLIGINSTILFLLSYFILFIVSQAVTVITAGFFNYPVILYYYDIYFNISQEAWYHDSVKTIYSSGPLIIFVIGIIFLILYTNVRVYAGTFKLFFLWGFLHAVNMLFGALLVGTLFDTGVGYVVSWMYIMDTGKLMYSTVSIFFLIITGILATKQFLISGNSYYTDINKDNRTAFIIAQVLMPYILGNIFLVAVRQPRFLFYDTFISLVLLIPILAILASYRSYHELYFEEEEKTARFSWKSLAALFLLVLYFRVILEFGLRFGN
jgi:hypothetical protein